MKNDIIYKVQGDDAWWTDHHHLTSTHLHTLPLYLASPSLDPPHTHTHPRWGEVSPQPREEERAEGDKGEKFPSSVLSSSYPHSLLFIGARQLCEKPRAPWNATRTNQELTRGRLGWAKPEAVRPTAGRLTRKWALLCYAFSRWMAGGSLRLF
jgi:hypothetical protein